MTAGDRVWLDHIPRSEREKFNMFIMLDEESIGLYQHASMWEGAYEAFRFEADGNKVRMHIRATEQQIGLSRPQRASNVQGAFKVAAERSADIAGRRVVLVDDVLTSGATTDACARALLRARAAQVDVLVFARVVDTHRAPI